MYALIFTYFTFKWLYCYLEFFDFMKMIITNLHFLFRMLSFSADLRTSNQKMGFTLWQRNIVRFDEYISNLRIASTFIFFFSSNNFSLSFKLSVISIWNFACSRELSKLHNQSLLKYLSKSEVGRYKSIEVFAFLNCNSFLKDSVSICDTLTT